MALQLKPRIDFGGIPFPTPVSEFSLQWLNQQFVPAQRTRRDLVISTCTSAAARIEAARSQAAKGLPVIGEKRPDGAILRTPYHLEMQRMAKTVADQQVADVARNILIEVDAAVIPIRKDMHRASLTVEVLRERIFTKMACLARMNAGMSDADEMAYRAAAATLVMAAEPVVLFQRAQAAIDRSAPQDFIMLHAILCENLKLNRDRRAFPNTQLLDLIEPPEYRAAQPLLASVIDLQKEADAAYQALKGHVDKAAVLRIARGLSQVRLDASGLPSSGSDDAV
jgi:hypothetical protein